MPIPNFVPLIGSGFDSLAGQQQQWAGFNRGIEEGNIARLAAAQANQNDWLRQAAVIRNQAMARDAEMAMAAQQQQAAQQWATQQEATRRAERKQELELTTAENKARLAAENRRTDVTESVAKMRQDMMEKAQELAIEQRGTTLAQNYGLVSKQAAAANDAYEKAQQQYDSMQARLDELSKKEKKTTEDLAELSDINKKMPLLKPTLRGVLAAKTKADNALNRIESAIAAHDFTVDDETGKIYHSPTGKSWNFRAELKAAQEAAAPPAVNGPLFVDTSAANLPTTPWGGMTGGTFTTLAPTLAPPEPTAAPAPTIRWTVDANGKLVRQSP